MTGRQVVVFEGAGRVVVPGTVRAHAIVTRHPLNFLAAYNKNLVYKWRRGKISDKEHPLHGTDLRAAVLFMPCSIGSTSGGMFLLEAIRAGIAPRGIVVETADPLLVAGGVLATTWLDPAEHALPPILECPAAFELVETGDQVEIRDAQLLVRRETS